MNNMDIVMEMANDDDELRVILEIFCDNVPNKLDLCNKNDTHSKNRNYFEETIQKYNLDDFKEHFRMSRTAFEKLMKITRVHFRTFGKVKVPLEKKLLLTIWLLAHPETFLTAGNRFGMAHSSAYFIFRETVKILNKLLHTFIRFPSNQERRRIASGFESISRIPGIVGCIGECQIPIKQPFGNSNDFNNREFHSIILQGISDDNLRFIDIFIGMSDRMYDANVYKNSCIYKKLIDNENPLLQPQHHFIGDNIYPNSNFMLTPYLNNEHLSNAHVKYNTALSSARRIIERSFGLLKGRFERIKSLEIQNIELGNSIVAACCILHNFILQEDGANDIVNTEFEPYEDDNYTEDILFSEIIETDKRQLFVTYFQ